MKNINIKTIMILFFSLAILSFLFALPSPVSADAPIIYVDDDNIAGPWNGTIDNPFLDIQEAIDNATGGETIFVLNGNYVNDVWVNKKLNITGAGADSVLITGQFYVSANDTVIENITIANISGGDFPAAIYDESSNSTYRNIRLLNNTYGLRLSSFSYNISIFSNLIERNLDGIYASNSNNITILNNYITDNVNNGIYLFNSNDNIIFHNTILNTSEIGIQVDGGNRNTFFDNYLDNIDNALDSGLNTKWNISKTDSVNGLSLNIIGGQWFGGNYWNDYSGVDLTLDGIGEDPYELDGVYDYLPLTHTYSQLFVDDDADIGWYDITHVHTIQEAVDNASYGASIYIYNGSYPSSTSINKSVRIIGESIHGVMISETIWVSSDFTIIENLTIVNVSGGESLYGIFDNSSNSTYSNLLIYNCTYGVYLGESTGGTIIKDSIIKYNEYGIYFDMQLFNSIINNQIINNSIGIYLYYSDFNTIYNNYFSNTINIEAINEGVSNNIWNLPLIIPVKNIIGGENLGGNYWENYTGIDNDADGIGDEIYIVYSDDYGIYYDVYPLTYNVNTPPLLGTPSLINESIDAPLEFNWSIPINDDKGWFSWNISCSNGQSIGLPEDENGTKNLHLSNLAYSTTYTIQVTVYDWYLWTNQTFTFTTVNKPSEKKEITNVPPVAHSGGPYAGYPSEQIFFYGGSSYDPDGEIVSYKWSLGDGTSAQESSTIHSYANAGTYTITLTVTDDEGATGSSSTRVVIIKPNNPPELLSSVSTNPGEYTAHLMITASDKDGDDISCSISWGDGESASITLSDGQTTTQTHSYPGYGSYTIRLSGNDGNAVTTRTHTISIISEVSEYEQTGAQGFSNMISTNESFIENQIGERSIIGSFLEKNYVIPAATILSIILLFLLNFLVEFLSDYSSEKALDLRENKKSSKVKKKTKIIQPHKFLSNREIFSVIITTILLTFVLSWTWVPDMESFWGFFTLTLLVVAGMIVLRESLRCYLCHKQKLASEFYVWPVGSIMMIVSTFLGNTFSLAANHNYDDEGDIRKCGKVTFTVAIVLYLIVVSSFIANILYPSLIFQMIVIATVLNLFIDLFPLKPMDGYEIRKWNFFIWVLFYALVIVSYVVVYFNLYP